MNLLWLWEESTREENLLGFGKYKKLVNLMQNFTKILKKNLNFVTF